MQTQIAEELVILACRDEKPFGLDGETFRAVNVGFFSLCIKADGNGGKERRFINEPVFDIDAGKLLPFISYLASSHMGKM